MSQTGQLIDALKKCLKSRGITYRELAAALNLSEATVKRNFSEQTFSLSRLEAACRYLELTIYDLAKMTRMQADDVPRELSESQEASLARDPILLTYFYLLITGWSAPRIAGRFGLDRQRNVALLKRLETLKLIELKPRNRVRLLTGRRINWRRGGPVRRLYEARVKAEFLHGRFDGPDEILRLESGELSEGSIRLLRRRIEQLAREFDEYAELDLAEPPQRKQAFALLLACRPWTFWSLLDPPTGQRGD